MRYYIILNLISSTFIRLCEKFLAYTKLEPGVTQSPNPLTFIEPIMITGIANQPVFEMSSGIPSLPIRYPI